MSNINFHLEIERDNITFTATAKTTKEELKEDPEAVKAEFVEGYKKFLEEFAENTKQEIDKLLSKIDEQTSNNPNQ